MGKCSKSTKITGDNMNQYRNQRTSDSGLSRGKGNSRGTRVTSASPRTTSSSRRTGRTSSAGINNLMRNTSAGRRGRNGYGNDQDGSDFMRFAVGGVILMLAIVCIVSLAKGMTGGKPSEAEAETVMESETELQREVSVDGINITGMSREDAKEAIMKNYPWAMKVVWQERTYEVPNLMEEKIDSLLQEIFIGEPKESYILDTSGLGEKAAIQAAEVAAQWDKAAKNGSISKYDVSSDSFLIGGAENGWQVNQEMMENEILAALERKDFDAVIKAVVAEVQPEISEATAKQKYKTLSSVTTKTTANNRRNTNVRLAAEAVNGTILQPGEEFSFNECVGERTEAKGYQPAAAYSNGEVVEEIGGGVCQISSTLYNAVLQAGLKTTVRRSHTYEPSYVTPGTDATISWGGPDYKFVNNSDTAVGLRAQYSNQTVVVSIYGIPVLEEGVKYTLKSTKLKDLDPPAPAYEEMGELEPGVEKTISSGTRGSQWETRLVVTKNGEIVSQEVDHTVTYKGHAPVIGRNTSGTVAETEPSETTESLGTTEPSDATLIERPPASDNQTTEPESGQSVTGPDNKPVISDGPSANGNSGQSGGVVSGHAPGSSGGNTPQTTQASPAPVTPGSNPNTSPSTETSATDNRVPSGGPGSNLPVVTPGPGM